MLFNNLVFTNKDTFLFCDWVTSKVWENPEVVKARQINKA